MLYFMGHETDVNACTGVIDFYFWLCLAGFSFVRLYTFPLWEVVLGSPGFGSRTPFLIIDVMLSFSYVAFLFVSDNC